MEAPSQKPARLILTDVCKDFIMPGGAKERFPAVVDVSLTVAAGEFISLIGASGCGKTTLLRMMSGLVARTGGTIQINGTPVEGVPARVGFVFQQPALLPSQSVYDNLRFVLLGTGLDSSDVDARIRDKLRLTGLEKFSDYYPHTLSGGMQQRVGLARALVSEPQVLFMDEPLSALDAFTRRRLQEEVSDIVANSGATAVLVTHDVDEAVFFSDRIVVMSSSPGTVQEIVGVDLQRPRRHADQLDNPLVGTLRDRVLGSVLGLK